LSEVRTEDAQKMKEKSNDLFRFGEFAFSPRERRLSRGNQDVPLSPKAFDLLEAFVRNHGNLVQRDELFSQLWPGVHVSEANLTNLIVQLRKILGPDAIQTVSKQGYRLMMQVTGEPGIKHQAYESFMRGRELLAQRSPETIEKARELFWFCLAHEPQFASAWAWLGRACHLLDKFGGSPGPADLAEAAFQRAFIIDPDLACAHQFYTQLQVDTGQAAQAMLRLTRRLESHIDDPETLAGLVQAFRYCGLPEQSVAAHQQAVCLDPTVRTSVAHTHFVRGEYPRVFETYTGALYYLDAAAWAALGAHDRAALLLRERLRQPALGKTMLTLMSSLLAVLDGQTTRAAELMKDLEGIRDPEVLFYFARHCAMLDDLEGTVNMVRCARLAGFWSSYAMKNDPVFSSARGNGEFQSEIAAANQLETHSLAELHQKAGPVNARFFGYTTKSA
jgi:DNA-binding winged helix-turn-helix (wHTH) protein